MEGPTTYYRNTLPIGDIDIESLWKLHNSNIVLVDDDEYRFLPFKEWKHLFHSV